MARTHPLTRPSTLRQLKAGGPTFRSSRWPGRERVIGSALKKRVTLFSELGEHAGQDLPGRLRLSPRTSPPQPRTQRAVLCFTTLRSTLRMPFSMACVLAQGWTLGNAALGQHRGSCAFAQRDHCLLQIAGLREMVGQHLRTFLHCFRECFSDEGGRVPVVVPNVDAVAH